MCPLLCKDNKNFRPNQKLSVREFGSIHFSTLRKHNRNRKKRAERLRMYWRFHLILLKYRAFVITTPNLRHRNAEPSTIRCRTFGQLVEPKNRFSKSPKALHQKHSFVPLSPFRQHSNAIGTTLLQLWDSTHAIMGRHSCNYGTVLSRKTKERKPFTP